MTTREDVLTVPSKHEEYAFPFVWDIRQQGEATFGTEPGMTLRDYFAAGALQGFCSDSDWDMSTHGEAAAKYAYMLADAMLKARKL